MMNSELISISMNDLSTVSGGQRANPRNSRKDGSSRRRSRRKSDYPEPHGNPVMQGSQMIDNAAQGWRAARQNGCSWYERSATRRSPASAFGGGFGSRTVNRVTTDCRLRRARVRMRRKRSRPMLQRRARPRRRGACSAEDLDRECYDRGLTRRRSR